MIPVNTEPMPSVMISGFVSQRTTRNPLSRPAAIAAATPIHVGNVLDAVMLGGFNRSSQRWLVDMIVDTRLAPRQVSSIRVSCEGGC